MVRREFLIVTSAAALAAALPVSPMRAETAVRHEVGRNHPVPAAEQWQAEQLRRQWVIPARQERYQWQLPPTDAV